MKQTIISLFLFTGGFLNASMICPPDKYLKCDADINNLYVTGSPQLFGSHQYYTPKYVDDFNTTICNVGHVIRRWYIDINNNDYPEYNEPTCYQDIFLSAYSNSNIQVSFPADIVVNCLDNIPYTGPQITGGPCDVIGVSYEDQVFSLIGSGDQGCKKILRKFTVINWCNYSSNNPYGGVWYGTQVIKIIDKEKPQILSCKDVTIGYNEGCKSVVTLKNKATDLGSCASAELFWTADIDLYGDGSIDFVFSHAAQNQFYLAPKKINEEVLVKLPGSYEYGIHKVLWKVKDACGNINSCLSLFTTKDNKPPTPYCRQSVSISVDGQDPWKVKVAASMFNLGAIDNCTASRYIRTSFSTDIADSMRFYDCTNAGFHTLKVYATDLRGNQDYCSVFLTVFDNGSCGNTLNLAGKAKSLNGKMLAEGKINMQANDNKLVLYRTINGGIFNFDQTAIYRDIMLYPSATGLEAEQIDLADFLKLKAFVTSQDTLSPLGYLAADINDDKRVNAKDYSLLKSYLLNDKRSFGENDWRFIPNYIDLEKVSLKDYSPVYDARKFNGALDFTVIAKGDLSESVLNQPDQRNNREDFLKFGNVVKMADQEFIPVYLEKNMTVQGMKLSLNCKSDKIKMANVDFDLAEIANNRTNLMVHEETIIENGHPIIFIAAEAIYGLEITGQYLGKNEVLVTKLLNKAVEITVDQLEVYPNPASSNIIIDAPLNSKLSIVRLNGMEVLSKVISGYHQQIDISTFDPGVYIVNITQGKKSTSKKIVKL